MRLTLQILKSSLCKLYKYIVMHVSYLNIQINLPIRKSSINNNYVNCKICKLKLSFPPKEKQYDFKYEHYLTVDICIIFVFLSLSLSLYLSRRVFLFSINSHTLMIIHVVTCIYDCLRILN